MNLHDLKNKTILLFGKPRAFSQVEFDEQMSFLQIEVVAEFSDKITLIVDGRMMTPYEQNLSDKLYEEKKAPAMSIDTLEKELVANIDEETLLMSLKLSHDKERLKSFIQNSMITNKLFFRLIKMYDWNGEDFFENDDNRDVSAAFIGRFYENIERNHNVQYATTGFIHLVAQAKESVLLEAIADLEPLSLHPKIKTAIAMSSFCDAKMQKRFVKKGGENILKALSLNKHLTRDLVDEFLKDEDLALNIVSNISLDETLFSLFIHKYKEVAHNETLLVSMQERLLALQDNTINIFLASNISIDVSIVNLLLAHENEELRVVLYENSTTPQKVLQEAYKNPLYHEALAKNENTPVEILYQLQLDSRYERFVKTNAGFGKHIQSENIGWMV